MWFCTIFNPLPSHEGRRYFVSGIFICCYSSIHSPLTRGDSKNRQFSISPPQIHYAIFTITSSTDLKLSWLLFGFCKLHPSFPVRIHRYFYVRLGFALPSISITNCFLSSYRSAFRLASQSFKKESHTGPIAKALPSFWSFLSLYNLCNWNTRQFY